MNAYTNRRILERALLTISFSFLAGLAMPIMAAENATTDIGTLDKATAQRAFPKAAVLAIRQAQLSDASILRRYASSHGLLDGRGCIW